MTFTNFPENQLITMYAFFPLMFLFISRSRRLIYGHNVNIKILVCQIIGRTCSYAPVYCCSLLCMLLFATSLFRELTCRDHRNRSCLHSFTRQFTFPCIVFSFSHPLSLYISLLICSQADLFSHIFSTSKVTTLWRYKKCSLLLLLLLLFNPRYT